MLNIRPTEMTPGKFYSLVKILESVDEERISKLGEFRDATIRAAELVQEQCAVLAKANNDMHQEARTSMRVRHSDFDSLEKQSADYNDFTSQVSDVNFLLIAYDTIRCVQAGYIGLLDTALNLKPKQLVLSDKKFDVGKKTIEDIQNMTYEFSLNAPAINSFLAALEQLESMNDSVDLIADKVYRSLDIYYRKLLHRHTVEGVKIHKDPVITDIAIMLFKNIDAHGEISEGKTPDKISAYTLRKAEILAEALRADSVHKFVQDAGKLLEYLTMNLKAFKNAANNLQLMFKSQLQAFKTTMDDHNRWSRGLSLSAVDKLLSASNFERTLMLITDVDPRNVSYTETTKLLSSEEKFSIKFREETIEKLANLLACPDFSAQEIVEYVLERKSKLREYFQDENSFYVSKIGGGNPFTGSAPGALEIIPGPKPNSNLNDIVGSGFKEIRKFISSVEDASKWNNLFLATSPSKTTDKSNVLLIGPVGCGKTEVFRAVGADKGSISVSVQGSDFNTCWKGEMEKNPKRLFEGALKLHKESKKQVHILIDEIDSVMNNDKIPGETNLSLEFQILMDGVVHYPKISIWGATNNPQRIPMAMIRRFSKVVIVGELDCDDRITLLKHFSSYLPRENFRDKDWKCLADRLDGATGDVVRKMIDHIWRDKMSWFVHNKPEAAQKMMELLNKETQFELSSFDPKDRFNFNQKLGKYFQVSPHDVHKSIDIHLDNIAIKTEIDTAKRTYANAKAFLNQLNASTIVSA
ncbi:hypothetical protein LCGC14_0478710 [marine sediment metagenome]|uniref:AAA+ ATPase domain-containing protein n=1 Tax=marine sediment metagenome TaxID=412755 RepID=A0A0F9ST08_9ZZZZ